MDEVLENLVELIDVAGKAFDQHNDRMRSLVAQLFQLCRNFKERIDELEQRVETLERGYE